ncbi:SCP2 domain-containing protein [uncultured Cardiobacterium sp.]|uniref:ubiquinone biosynthesis accessory factor UbiJ n=1 Tax=uncultured Cardiobacterium sp. TaxID=417619 RepID=UPI002630A761|nr:SCP2 sterol-binding domain-containing protein [uncultured Cardiobacterium sp.]
MLEQYLDARLLVEQLINGALRLDPAARDKLAALNGRRISIDLAWRDTPWIAEITDGAVRLSDDHVTPCDIRLKGDLAGYLQLFKHPSGDTPRGKLHIEGDLHTAQQFQRVMGELAPDYAAVLRARFGDDLGGLLAEALRRLQSAGTGAKAALDAGLRDYLEKHGAATRTDAAAFAGRLAALIRRIERLETRLAQEAR